jgi:hypothetical protein
VYLAFSDHRNGSFDIFSTKYEPPIVAEELRVDGFLASDSGIQHIISHMPSLNFQYRDINSDTLARYNVSVWNADGSELLWFCNRTESLPSGSEVTVTYNTAPCPTNGALLEDGTTYKFRVKVQNSSGGWSGVSQVEFHLNEVLAPIPFFPDDNTLQPSATDFKVNWTSPGLDSEGDSPISYNWEVATDSAFTDIIESGSGSVYESGAFDTSPQGDFYWRVNLTDGWETSLYGNQPDGFWNFTSHTPPIQNSPPAITNKASVPTKATTNSELSFTFTATDPDSDTLTWSKISGPEWLSIDTTTGMIQGTPSSVDIGPNHFTIRVSDGNGGEDDYTFTIAVNEDADEDGQDMFLWLIVIIIIVVILILLVFLIRKKKPKDDLKPPDNMEQQIPPYEETVLMPVQDSQPQDDEESYIPPTE